MTFAEPPRPQDKAAIVTRVPLFSELREDERQFVAERTRLVEYKKGESVYREGDRADALYLVSSGRLKVFSDAAGAEHIYAVLHNGDTFGEISLLTGETHSATVEALNDTLVLRLDKAEFDEVITRIPSLVLSLSRLLSKRLRTKEHPIAVGDATVVAVHSAVRGVGRTTFSLSLAALLRRETQQPVIVVDFSTTDQDRHPLLHSSRAGRVAPISIRSLWSEEAFEREILEHPLGFHLLDASEWPAQEPKDQLVVPLINQLTTRYSYIVVDLPPAFDTLALKTLTQADLAYVVTDADQDNLVRTHAMVRQAREAIARIDDRLKVVLNGRLASDENQHPETAAPDPALELVIAIRLPHIETEQGTLDIETLSRLLADERASYTRAVRRIARELGGLLVGLALGSGAALGLAHVGLIKVFEREKIPIDLIAGSSIGALIGAMWAAGIPADRLEEIAKRFQHPWKVRALFLDFGIPLASLIVGLLAGILVGWLGGFWNGFLFGTIVTVSIGLVFGPLSGGPLQGTRVTQFLEEILGNTTFEETQIPIKIVASNPTLREEVVFERGRLVDAVRASIAIPGIFKPVRLMGRSCLDGGVINPVPVSILKRAGAKRIIAVNVFPTTPELRDYAQTLQRRRGEKEAQLASRNLLVRLWTLLRRELWRSISPLIFDVIVRSMQSMEYQIAEIACHDADLTLRPTMPGSHWLEFHRPQKFIQRGEEEALSHLQELKRLTRPFTLSDAATLTSGPASLTTQEQTGTIPT